MKYKITKIKLFYFLLAMAVILISALLFIFTSKYCHRIYNDPNQFDPLIAAAARRHNIDPNLIKAVIWQESAFAPLVTGPKDEKGLMQLMKKHSVQDYINFYSLPPFPDGLLYDPEVNIEIGSWYMSKCLKRWNKSPENIVIGLAEYNAGYSNVRKWLGEEPPPLFVEAIRFPSTKTYCLKILEKYEEYKKKR